MKIFEGNSFTKEAIEIIKQNKEKLHKLFFMFWGYQAFNENNNNFNYTLSNMPKAHFEKMLAGAFHKNIEIPDNSLENLKSEISEIADWEYFIFLNSKDLAILSPDKRKEVQKVYISFCISIRGADTTDFCVAHADEFIDWYK
jgi:hypothetical protein